MSFFSARTRSSYEIDRLAAYVDSQIIPQKTESLGNAILRGAESTTLTISSSNDSLQPSINSTRRFTRRETMRMPTAEKVSHLACSTCQSPLTLPDVPIQKKLKASFYQSIQQSIQTPQDWAKAVIAELGPSHTTSILLRYYLTHTELEAFLIGGRKEFLQLYAKKQDIKPKAAWDDQLYATNSDPSFIQQQRLSQGPHPYAMASSSESTTEPISYQQELYLENSRTIRKSTWDEQLYATSDYPYAMASNDESARENLLTIFPCGHISHNWHKRSVCQSTCCQELAESFDYTALEISFVTACNEISSLEQPVKNLDLKEPSFWQKTKNTVWGKNWSSAWGRRLAMFATAAAAASVAAIKLTESHSDENQSPCFAPGEDVALAVAQITGVAFPTALAAIGTCVTTTAAAVQAIMSFLNSSGISADCQSALEERFVHMIQQPWDASGSHVLASILKEYEELCPTTTSKATTLSQRTITSLKFTTTPTTSISKTKLSTTTPTQPSTTTTSSDPTIPSSSATTLAATTPKTSSPTSTTTSAGTSTSTTTSKSITLSFASPVNYSCEGGTITAADFNGDGKLDIALSGIYVLLGNGDGTFKRSVKYSTTNYATSGIVAADFNKDGKIDLASAVSNIVNKYYSYGAAIILGNGNGTFQSAVNSYTTGIQARDITSSDFNRDGKIDLAITNSGSDYISVLLGKGDGTFQPAVNFPSSLNSLYITARDFNGDGKIDLATTPSFGSCTRIFLGKGDGTFQPGVCYSLNQSPTSVTGVFAADFNGDGKIDLATANAGNANNVSVLLGNGDGTFQPAVNYSVGDVPIALYGADFNGDGKIDLATATANVATNNVSILLGKGDGTFEPALSFSVLYRAYNVFAADFNGDGKVDLAVQMYQNSGYVAILLNTSS